MNSPMQSRRDVTQTVNRQVKMITVSKVSTRPAKRHVTQAANSSNQLEQQAAAVKILENENKLLQEIISTSSSSIEELRDQLSQFTADLPKTIEAAAAAAAYEAVAQNADNAEDLWSPLVKPDPTGAMVDTVQEYQPPPSHDGTHCLSYDNFLGKFQDHFKYRWHVYNSIRAAIDEHEGGMEKFSSSYNHYGLHRGEHNGKTGLWYREWAPAAQAIALVGEFNDWEPQANHYGIKNSFGVFELFLPDKDDGSWAVPHRCKVKCRVQTENGEWAERIPAWITWATQEWNEIQYNGVFYCPKEESPPGVFEPDKKYVFKYPRPPRPRNLRIYECHVGMSSKEPKINSYTEFKEDMLPRIRKLGYNSIQIMAIQEHAYYGSFGYHVTNFFAASSRSGTPDELKAMIDEAHRMGIVVLMDIVHSHASKNVQDGLNMFDGTDHQYFHGGDRGYHWMWDSRLFNYSNWETLRFLLSNSRWWVDEYKFDGYRFDGVTSMMYHHHGLSMAFTGNYEEYFGMATDVDAVVYLMLVNSMLHDLYPTSITIGEDVSGMPTFCRPVNEGGVGFDYRLAMAIPDKWIEMLSKMTDDQWNMGNLVYTLTNRRHNEKCVAYAESHDQALVGDKTVAFWLMDKEMYDFMAVPPGPDSAIIDRGIALHKIIRLLTMALGGESYLNFMGNEFGHPEWIDFPRDDSYDPSTGAFVPGNMSSYDKCRRRWDLVDNENLKYKYMNNFDRAINHLDRAFGFVASDHQYVSRQDEGDKVIVFERGPLTFVCNLHPTNSYSDYRVGTYVAGPYKILLSSDEAIFGGFENVTAKSDTVYNLDEGDYDGRPRSFQVYMPSRTLVVYGPAEYVDSLADTKPTGIPGLAVKGRGPFFSF